MKLKNTPYFSVKKLIVLRLLLDVPHKCLHAKPSYKRMRGLTTVIELEKVSLYCSRCFHLAFSFLF